jgi:DNA-directed RNA polymerase alpha subunit
LASDDEPEGVVFWYEASLTTRAQNVLSHHDETKFASPKAIAEMGERQLMRFPGFGRTSLEVVREALREQFGRKLHP